MTEGRPPSPPVRDDRELSVADRLFREPYRFDFFQAVRLLERIFPDQQPVGGTDPQDEVVRFRSHVSLAFPASEVQDVTMPPLPPPGEKSPPPTMLVNIMGLVGPLGVLPRHYTALLLDQTMRHQVGPLREFLDLFTHRFVSLFYRAWEKYRFPVAYERTGQDTFSDHLFCLIGMGLPSVRKKLRISDQILLFYGGLLSNRPRAAVALEGLLQDYFGVEVHVEQFTGQWFLMNPDVLTQLGPGGRNNRLGVDAVLWERVWDPQARFRVRLGPLTRQQFLDFLPTSQAYHHVVELTRFFVGEEFSFEVQPTLRADEVPWCALGDPKTSRLGWAMWLKTAPFDHDTEQPILTARVATMQPDAPDLRS